MFVARGANVLLIFLTTFLLHDVSAAARIDGKMLTDFHGSNVPHQQYRLVIGNTHVLGYSVDDPGGHHLLMPIWAYRVAASYLFFISVIGLILNVIVIIVLLNDPKKMTPLNWMLFNLACSDGIIAGFGAPISAVAALHSGWPFSEEFCVAYAVITSTAGTGSITTLTALAIYRCKLVVQKHVHPPNRLSAFTNHSALLERRQAALLLTLIWCYALAVTCPPLFGWGHYDREAAHISCSVNWELKVGYNRSYIFYMFAMGLFVPTVVIVVSYLNILRVVRKVKREIGQRSILVKMQTNLQKIRRSDAAEKRSTVMVAVMIGAFMITWLPYSVLALVEFFSSHFGSIRNIPPVWDTLPCLLAKTSVVLNPIIYGFLNTQFRLAWENFSVRFLGRQRRPYSQGMLGATSSNDQPPVRQLLTEFSPDAGPLTRILAQSISSPSKARQNLSSPPCLLTQRQTKEKKEKVLIDEENQLPSSTLITPSEVTATGSTNPLVRMKDDEQKELPVSLEIVRYLRSADIHRIRMPHSLGT